MIAVTFLAALALGDPSREALSSADRPAPLEERTVKVGMIFIIGHEDAVTSFLLNQLDFKIGDVVTERRLRDTERRLAGLGRFVVDPSTGVRPHIRIEENGEYTNLWIEVVEKEKTAGPR